MVQCFVLTGKTRHPKIFSMLTDQISNPVVFFFKPCLVPCSDDHEAYVLNLTLWGLNDFKVITTFKFKLSTNLMAINLINNGKSLDVETITIYHFFIIYLPITSNFL